MNSIPIRNIPTGYFVLEETNGMKRYQWAILFGTTYLVMYVSLFQLGASQALLGALFAISPAVVIWMVYDILRHAQFNGRELGEGEEFGYSDKKTEELGLF